MPPPACILKYMPNNNIEHVGFTAAEAAEILRKLADGVGHDSIEQIQARSGNATAARERRVREALAGEAGRLSSS